MRLKLLLIKKFGVPFDVYDAIFFSNLHTESKRDNFQDFWIMPSIKKIIFYLVETILEVSLQCTVDFRGYIPFKSGHAGKNHPTIREKSSRSDNGKKIYTPFYRRSVPDNQNIQDLPA